MIGRFASLKFLFHLFQYLKKFVGRFVLLIFVHYDFMNYCLIRSASIDFFETQYIQTRVCSTEMMPSGKEVSRFPEIIYLSPVNLGLLNNK